MSVTLPLTIDTKYSGLPIHLSLEKRVNLLSVGSGGGKTFILDILESWFKENGFSVYKLDYHTADVCEDLTSILALCKASDVVLLDNLRLLPYRELIPALSKQSSLVIAAGNYVSGVRFEDYICVTFTSRGVVATPIPDRRVYR